MKLTATSHGMYSSELGIRVYILEIAILIWNQRDCIFSIV